MTTHRQLVEIHVSGVSYSYPKDIVGANQVIAKWFGKILENEINKQLYLILYNLYDKLITKALYIIFFLLLF